MLIFAETPPSFNWRRQIVFALLGLAISGGLMIVLRRTSLSPTAISFAGTLPMWFLLSLGSSMAGPHLRAGVRIARAVGYAILVDFLFYLLMRAYF